ncbi:hypothetical protein BFJ67_g17402 [Fusarium oxysporum f. sp. cepae]|nr:hypothetical protein BFJ67_g17402 [Fusarium oxysporum f. sp. cepae]
MPPQSPEKRDESDLLYEMNDQEIRNSVESSHSKFLTSCDACRARKVRCIKRHHADIICINCDKRAEDCRFSRTRVRKSRTAQSAQPHDPARAKGQSTNAGAAQPVTPLSDETPMATSRGQPHSHLAPSPLNQELGIIAIDPSVQESQVESCHSTVGPAEATPSLTPADHPVIMANEEDVCSSSLAYFSNGKLTALSRTLGHTRVAELIKRIESAVRSRIRHSVKAFPSPGHYAKEARSIALHKEMRLKYIESYFQEVHPVYPFIDRTSFEGKALSPQLEEFLSGDSAWCALYHAVLALGSLYHDCGSFVAFSGAAWEIFRVSLSLFTRLIFGRRTLVAAQAVTAMAIFGLTYVSLPIEDVLITEAARIATSLQMNRGDAGEIDTDFQRTFWVIYSLESEFCFNTGRASAIPYHDISCPIPHTSLSLYSTFNWLQVLSSYALMISRIYERLFSVKAKSLSKEIRRTEALRAFEELENWKDSIPESFRPGMPIRSHRLGKSQAVALSVQIRFCYHNIRIALSRVSISASTGDSENQMRYKLSLTDSARAIIEVVHLVHPEPFVLPWIQYHMPQSALFLLFDFIIENPCHEETQKDLSYMQIIASYFMRLQYATQDDADSTLSTEFYQIASKFVENVASSRDSEKQTGEDLDSLERWLSYNNDLNPSILNGLLGSQGFPFLMPNGFTLEETDFWLQDTSAADGPEIGRDTNGAELVGGLLPKP